jgi:hypothetical protein
MSQLNDSQQRPPGLGPLAVRKAGHSALIVIACIAIWAISTRASGYFWPGWVILIATLSFLTQVGKAAFGDGNARKKLENRYHGSR